MKWRQGVIVASNQATAQFLPHPATQGRNRCPGISWNQSVAPASHFLGFDMDSSDTQAHVTSAQISAQDDQRSKLRDCFQHTRDRATNMARHLRSESASHSLLVT
jgi:hypothetical protein